MKAKVLVFREDKLSSEAQNQLKEVFVAFLGDDLEVVFEDDLDRTVELVLGAKAARRGHKLYDIVVLAPAHSNEGLVRERFQEIKDVAALWLMPPNASPNRCMASLRRRFQTAALMGVESDRLKT